jgi:putative chitobiose transport system permease protein
MIDRRPTWLTLVLYIGAGLLGGLALGPGLFLLLVALQPSGTSLFSIPTDPTMRNFEDAWTQGRLAGPLLNSVIVTLVRATLNVLLAALAAYPLARMQFRGRSAIFVLILATMMIPEQVIVVPMFRTVVQMGLVDTLAAVIIPFSVSAFGVYLCKQAFEQIPVSLEEAARIDGAGALRVWWHVMLPLAAPSLATLALFSMIGAWSELLWPLIVLQSSSNYTLPVAVNQLLGQFADNPRLPYAAAVLTLVPIIVVFIASQRFLKGQLFAGGVKG